MKEENYDKLRRALDQLPTYDAPDQLWNGLDTGLNKEPEPNALGKKLPAFSPPTTVWNKLNGALDQDRKKRGRIRSLYRWTARAAAAILIFGAGYFAATHDAGPKVTYVYSQEPSDQIRLVDWGGEEESFDRVMQRLAEIDEPNLNALRLELEELNAAKKEVEDMLRAYGEDSKVVRQLAEIETERSRVYRQAIAKI